MATATSSTSTVARTLTPEEWEKAVCALFTNVKLYSNSKLDPKVEGIKQILTKKGILIPNTGDSWCYNPCLTALYEMNPKGVIVDVFFSESDTYPKIHAEEKFLESMEKKQRPVHSIGLNYSPCTIEGHDCAREIVKKYEDTKDKPEIHFSQVYKKKGKKTDGEEGIKLLIENGFILKRLETNLIFQYLLDQAPTKELERQLRLAYESTADVRSQCDESTGAF